MNTLSFANTLTYPSAIIAGLVATAMEENQDLDMLVASTEDRIRLTTNGVVASGLTDEAVSKLRQMGCEVTISGEFAHVTPNLEFAAKSRAASRKKAAVSTEIKKRLSADERRKQDLENNSLRFLTTPQAAALVKRVWQNHIEAEDYRFYPQFFKELDNLIAEYRILAGTDAMPDIQVPDDEDETDDYDKNAVIGSADQARLPLENTAVEELDRAAAERAA